MASKSKKYFPQKKSSKVILGGFIVAILPIFYFTVPEFFVVNYQSSDKNESEVAEVEGVSLKMEEEILKPKTSHIATPEAVKGIYMTSCVVSTPSFRQGLVSLVETTELNSIIIDIKDFTGTLSFKPENPELLHAWENARCGTSEMKDFIEELHNKNIYVIGRITVFQDPHMSVRRPDLAVQKASDGSTWKDFKGLSFTNPTKKEIWDYHVMITKEAYDMGFDELNFDYVRFPSDGPMKDISFPGMANRSKAEVLEEFFEYLHKNLKDTKTFRSKPPILSADLFGMTTTNTDDLNIGQVWERTIPYFDYVMPMVYPSHYPKNFNGWLNPNTVPYELIKFVMGSAVKRNISPTTSVKTLTTEPIYNEIEKFDSLKNATTTESVFSGLYQKEVYDKNKARPWIQDFNYGGTYGPAEVRAQIQGTYDVGLNSWIVWDPANKYSSLRQILKSE